MIDLEKAVGAAELEKLAKVLVDQLVDTLRETEPGQIFEEFPEGHLREMMRSVSYAMSLAVLALETIEERSTDVVSRSIARQAILRIDAEADRQSKEGISKR